MISGSTLCPLGLSHSQAGRIAKQAFELHGSQKLYICDERVTTRREKECGWLARWLSNERMHGCENSQANSHLCTFVLPNNSNYSHRVGMDAKYSMPS